MKKLVLGTLICLAACGEFEPKFGSPEDHAVPEIAPHELGLNSARVLQSPGRHIRFIQPDGWELFDYPTVSRLSFFNDINGPDKEHYLSGVFFHPRDRVVCHAVSQVDLDGASERFGEPRDVHAQMAFLELQASFSDLLDGFVYDAWLHPDDARTSAPIFEEQWHFIHWDEDYPAIGFGVAETTDQTTKHAFCYWLDGARGDNEIDLLTDIRGAVQFAGVR